MAKFEDLTGETINGIDVISLCKRGISHNTWNCLCPVCQKEFTIVGGRTIIERAGSCRHCKLYKKGKINGLSHSRIYKIYRGMLIRCFNKESKAYTYYGGKGITVYNDWVGENGFMNFYY